MIKAAIILVFLLPVLAYRAARTLLFSYIAAPNEEEALKVIDIFLKAGYHIISDPLGEFVKAKELVPDIALIYENHLYGLHAKKWKYPDRDIAVAVKPSRLGFDIDQEVFEQYAGRILALARDLGLFVWFDAEKKAAQESTLTQLLKFRARGFTNFGLALQAMHTSSSHILDRIAEADIAVRIVKGAYQDGDLKLPAEITSNFSRLFGEACESYRGALIAVGTHDEDILRSIRGRKIQYQFLFGIRTRLQEEFLADGENVAIYIPWGKIRDALGFFIRRMKEGVKWNALALFVRNIEEAGEFRKKYGLK